MIIAGNALNLINLMPKTTTFRCLKDDKCYAYQYKETGPRNCILIHSNCADANRQIFESSDNTPLFKKGLRLQNRSSKYQHLSQVDQFVYYFWLVKSKFSCCFWHFALHSHVTLPTLSGLIPHYGWEGPKAAFYQSFDGSEGLVLRQGDQPMSHVPLVPGTVMTNELDNENLTGVKSPHTVIKKP